MSVPCSFCMVCSRSGCETRSIQSDPAPTHPAETGGAVNTNPTVPVSTGTVNFPPINEPSVTGLPNNKVWQKVNIGQTVTLSGVKDLFVNNPWCYTVSGLSVICNKSGSTCVKIILKDNSVRLYGLYTSDTPEYRLQIGSVSEHDPINAMRWWSEFDCKNLADPKKILCNKKCDLFYIYLNGGPQDMGWRQNYSSKQWNTEPEGKRARNFLRNTQRLGGHACFVYYNIPAGSESYQSNKMNYEDGNYMKSYFYDLNFLLEILNQESPNNTVYIILEPDMMSYILQNEPPSSDNMVHPKNVKMDLSQVQSLGFPEFKNMIVENNLRGWVTLVNTLIHKKCPQVLFAHKVNLWGTLTALNWDKGFIRGLIPATDIIGQQAGLDLISRNADIISNFYKEAGASMYTKYCCFDKYGLDGALVNTSDSTSPEKSRWFFNHDLWNNYIFFCQRVALKLETSNIILWQLPCGYINSCQESSPYTEKPFPDLKNVQPSGEDGGICYVFGSVFKRTANLEYFSKNDWKDTSAKTVGNTITWSDKTKELYEKGVSVIMFGAGVGASTTNIFMNQTSGIATDNKYGIFKFQNFYNNHYK